MQAGMSKYYIALEENKSLGFTLHFLSSRREQKMPTIIYLHGFTGSKENHLNIRLGLADQGFLVVSFDARDHGDRRPLPELWNSCRDNFMETFLEVLFGTVDDTLSLYHHLSSRSEVDPDRIALMGGSMGAMICLMSIPRLPTLRAAVSMAGTMDFMRWQKETAGHELYRFHRGEISEKTRMRLDEYEAKNHLGSFFPLPLLMVHGAQDELVPPRGQEDLYKQLKPFYKTRPDLLSYRLFPQLAHETSPELLATVHHWFTLHLMAS
jgi:pimeloyl-ACP methyl ester carboxylesterase